MKYAYYISCINDSLTKELDQSLHLWKSEFDIELVPLEEGTCCGGSNLDFVSPDHYLVVNGRNIALAEKLGLDLITSCNTCLLGLRSAKHQLDSSEEKRAYVNEMLKPDGLEYTGKSEVKHLLWVLNEDYGLDKIKEKVKNPLNEYKIAPFYGCHILRPSNVMGIDDPNQPSSLDSLIQTLGGSVTPYGSKNKCCGFHTLNVAEEESLELSGSAVQEAIEENADFVVTPCPLCHFSLDAYQSNALKQKGVSGSMKILHLSQMVGLALGYSEKELGINKHVTK